MLSMCSGIVRLLWSSGGGGSTSTEYETSSNDQVPPSQYTGNSVGGVLVKKSSTDDDCLVEENNRSEVISSTEDSKPKRTDEPIRRVRVRLTTTEPRKVVCITRTLSNPASRTRIADSSRLVLVPSVHRGDYGGIERKPFRQSVMEKTHPSGVESAKEETSQADHLFIDSSLRDEANESNPGLSSTPKDADTISGTVLENPDEAENPSDSVSETEHLVRNSVSDTDAGVEPQTVKQLLPADDAQSSVGEACDEDKTCTTGSTANICFVRSCLRRSSSFTAPRYGVERLPPYRPTRKVSQVPDANKPSSLSNNGPVIPVPGIQPGFDIAHLTESALRDLYEPFDTYRAQIVRQARDIFVCSYFGDLSKFDEEFLKPAAELLKKFKESTLTDLWFGVTNNKEIRDILETHGGKVLDRIAANRSKTNENALSATLASNSFTQEGKQGFGFGWPLCHNDHILVHLGEGESRTVLLPGDIYLYVCDGCTSTNVGLKAKIKTQDNANVADIVIDESHFAHVFTMDWPSTASSSMSELCEIVFELNSLVTCVERGIDRLRWQSAVLCPPNFDVQSYDCLSEKRNSLSKSSASMSNNYQCQKSKEKSASDSNDTTTDVDDDGYHDDDPGLIHQISSLSQLDSAMLHTGNVILPGCRDVDGRAVAFISKLEEISKNCCTEVIKFLSYFSSIVKKDVLSKGLVIVLDLRQNVDESTESTALDNIINLLEGVISGISKTIILYGKPENSENIKIFQDKLSLPPYSDYQSHETESLEDLKRYIPLNQIPESLGGSFAYDHETWIQFKIKQEDFMSNGKTVGYKLVNLMQEIKDGLLPLSHAMTKQVIVEHRRMVTDVIRDDDDLKKYRNEAKGVKLRLQEISTKYPDNRDFSDGLAVCEKLHKDLERAICKVAKLANKRLHKLEKSLHIKSFEEESNQVLSWLRKKGEESLNKHVVISEDLPNIKRQEREFEKFYFTAMRNIEKGQDLIEEATMLQQSSTENDVGDVATSLKEHLSSFSCRLEDRRETLEGTSRCYHLLDKSYEWAVNVMKFLSNLKMVKVADSSEDIEKFLEQLQSYLIMNPPVADCVFDDMDDLAKRVNNKRLIEQIKVARDRCEETKELIKARQTTLLKAKLQLELHAQSYNISNSSISSSRSNLSPRSQQWPSPNSSSTPYGHQHVRRSSLPAVSSHNTGPYCTLGSLSHALNRRVTNYEDSLLGDKLITEDLTEQGPVTSISKTLLSNRSKENKHASEADEGENDNKLLLLSRKLSGGMYHKPVRKLFKRSNSYQIDESSLEKCEISVSVGSCSPERRRSVDSVGSSLHSEDSSGVVDLSDSKQMISQYENSVDSKPDTIQLSDLAQEPSSRAVNQQKSKRTLSLIMNEMIQTERDYVSSLEYIIENYISEVMREDIPQALRGQRNVIFGNIEKIYEFHSQFFLQELEQCQAAPFLVGLCFLRYDPQFYLYALYNKNKPKCDNLMTEYGNQFFKSMQMELGDKMDLASYLLKPVQRMGKYALLLKQLLKECPVTASEYQDLRAAEDMVRFQLRHGNDLLAMDALRECDVNVKEQGRLLRQDEFLVMQGKTKKTFRRVFLFEELILFSKPRRDQENKGHEIYQYKNSIKTTDIGLTEQVGDSSVKFEIWFRKRKQNDIYSLQSPSTEVRMSWVQEISKQLWKQALKNKEVCQVEMSSMGIGNKPCLDLKPGEDQINDRAININFTKGSWQRRSAPSSAYDSFSGKRPHSIISISSSSSSGSSSQSSQYGALNFGFESSNSSRSLYRSGTQHSQCSNESGICPDISLMDGIGSRIRKKAERSDSLISTDSMMTHASGFSHSGSVNSNKVLELDEVDSEP